MNTKNMNTKNMNTKNLKPFNLDEALDGEPLTLRNGMKAFVRHHETESKIGECWQVWGIGNSIDGSYALLQWSTSGKYKDEVGVISDFDIIGMWPKTRIINGFEVPAPETTKPDFGTTYFTSSLTDTTMMGCQEWNDDGFDTRALKRGIVFLNAEDAIANAKAMLGINPYEEVEE